MADHTKIEAQLSSLGDYIIHALAAEIIQQGHYATGSLANELKQDVTSFLDRYELTIYMNDYGQYVDTGRKAGARRVPIDALIEWLQVKKFAGTDKQLRQIAFAIQTKIFQEGIPTAGSFAFSENQRRTEWLTRTVIDKQEYITNTISQIVEDDFSAAMDNMIRGLQYEFKKAA